MNADTVTEQLIANEKTVVFVTFWR